MNRTLAALKRWRRVHILCADTVLALSVVVAILGVLLLVTDAPDLLQVLNGNRAAMYGTIASICGALLGFVLTSLSIISVFARMPKFSLLREAKQLPHIFNIFFHTVHFLAFGTVWALIGLVVDTDASPYPLVTVATAMLMAIVIAGVWRCIWVLKKMVRISVRRPVETQPTP